MYSQIKFNFIGIRISILIFICRVAGDCSYCIGFLFSTARFLLTNAVSLWVGFSKIALSKHVIATS